MESNRLAIAALTACSCGAFYLAGKRQTSDEQFRLLTQTLQETKNSGGGGIILQKEHIAAILPEVKKFIQREVRQNGENEGLEKSRRWDSNWDRRQPEKLVKPLKEEDLFDAEKVAKRREKVEEMTPKVNHAIALIRHGQYKMDGEDDLEHKLTELGRAQAKETGLRIKELIDAFRDGQEKNENGEKKAVKIRLVMSTMTRATETANLILEQLPEGYVEEVKSCSMIREGACTEPLPMYHGFDPAEYFEESSRIEAGFRRHIHRADPEETAEVLDIIVCHGNVIRYFLCRALQLPQDAWLRFSLPHGSISSFIVRPSGRVGLRGYAESGHFKPEMVTF